MHVSFYGSQVYTERENQIPFPIYNPKIFANPLVSEILTTCGLATPGVLETRLMPDPRDLYLPLESGRERENERCLCVTDMG